MTTIDSAPTTAAYDDLGTGDPTLLLLPGWCGDRDVFDPVAGLLAEHRRVVVTDLRGHGGLAHQRGDFDTTTQVDDLVARLDGLGVDRVVPVGLSHAGWFAIELRRRVGAERVPGLVLLDWMPLGAPPGFDEALAGLQGPAWQSVRAALFDLWASGVEHAGVLDYVASMGGYGFEHWRRAGREISAAFAREGTPLSALDALGTPTLHLYAQPADPGHLAAQQQAAVDRPWFSVVRLDAVSHFPVFEVPDVVASTIEEFVCSLA